MLSEDVIKYLTDSGFEAYFSIPSNLSEMFAPSFVRTDECECCKRRSSLSVYSDGSFDAYDERGNRLFTGGVNRIESVDDLKLVMKWVFQYR